MKFFALIIFGLAINGAVQKEISGKVLDIHNRPLPGVNVLIKGTPKGTISDANGDFILHVNEEKVTLVFSYINFKSVEQEIRLLSSSRRRLNVTLIKDKKRYRKIMSKVSFID